MNKNIYYSKASAIIIVKTQKALITRATAINPVALPFFNSLNSIWLDTNQSPKNGTNKAINTLKIDGYYFLDPHPSNLSINWSFITGSYSLSLNMISSNLPYTSYTTWIFAVFILVPSFK